MTSPPGLVAAIATPKVRHGSGTVQLARSLPVTDTALRLFRANPEVHTKPSKVTVRARRIGGLLLMLVPRTMSHGRKRRQRACADVRGDVSTDLVVSPAIDGAEGPDSDVIACHDIVGDECGSSIRGENSHCAVCDQVVLCHHRPKVNPQAVECDVGNDTIPDRNECVPSRMDPELITTVDIADLHSIDRSFHCCSGVVHINSGS